MRRGQVAVYLVLVLVVITLLMLLNVDAFLIVRERNHMMNASDAAALAAAKEQGRLLNEIGKLNLRHAEADARGDYEESLRIVREQKRLAFLGPLNCLRLAQKAARANDARDDGSLAAALDRHVVDIRQKYKVFPDLYPEPWEGAWDEYAGQLAGIVGEGIAAGQDNADYLDVVEVFPLTAKSFYKMIEGEVWCKLKVAGWEWLLSRDSSNMPRPMDNEVATVVNSEICSLHLTVKALPDMAKTERDEFLRLLTENGAQFPPKEAWVTDMRDPEDPSRYYFFYDSVDETIPDYRKCWRKWTEIDRDAEFRFPVCGKVKPVFDVLGCAPVFRVAAVMPHFFSEQERTFGVDAAAKPFGVVMVDGQRSVVITEETYGMVLPTYEAVRLIPIAAATRGGRDPSTSDLKWLNHICDHVRQYLSFGVEGLPSDCSYCQQLVKWENPDFRREAAKKMQTMQCAPPVSGPTIRGGGAYPLP